eukprot:jgi/Mesvir1/9650/Mv12142-RA.1
MPVMASAETEHQFLEKYALSTLHARQDVVKELSVPGSLHFYFFSALNEIHRGDLDAAEQTLSLIERQFGTNSGYRQSSDQPFPEMDVAEIKRLVMLKRLEAPGGPTKQSLEYLKRELSLDFDDARPARVPDSTSPVHGELTARPPAALKEDAAAAEAFRQHALKHENGGFSQLEECSYAWYGQTYLRGNHKQKGGEDQASRINQQRGQFLDSILRPDIPNLVELVAADFQDNPYLRFGHRRAHRLLTLRQLEDLRPLCAERLLSSQEYIKEYVRRLSPTPDCDAQQDDAELARFFARVRAFCESLPSSANWLRATVLYHQLELMQRQRSPSTPVDLALLVEYLSVPKTSAPYGDPGRMRERAMAGVSRQLQNLKKSGTWWHLPGRKNTFEPEDIADLRTLSDHPLLPPVYNDEALVYEVLCDLFMSPSFPQAVDTGRGGGASKDEIELALQPFDWLVDEGCIRREYLLTVMAEARLFAGDPKPDRWYAILRDTYGDSAPPGIAELTPQQSNKGNLMSKMVKKMVKGALEPSPSNNANIGGYGFKDLSSGGPASGDALQGLNQKVEINFLRCNRRFHSVDDGVTLQVALKNVPVLLVKIFEIQSYNYYCQKWRELDTGIDLDGLRSSHEREHRFTQPPMQRFVHQLAFPELAGRRGVFVVELIGNGVSCRAMVCKGGLRYLERTSAAGQVFTVLTEDNAVALESKAFLQGVEYVSDASSGEILVPFAPHPDDSSQPIVFSAAGLSLLARVTHMAEKYQLRAGIHVDWESLVSRATAPILLRASLVLNGEPVPLSLLEGATLQVASEDIEGTQSLTTVDHLALHADKETIHPIKVPERLVRLTVTLKGVVRQVSGGGGGGGGRGRVPVGSSSGSSSEEIEGTDSEGGGDERGDREKAEREGRMVHLSVDRTWRLNQSERFRSPQDVYLARDLEGYHVRVLGRSGEPFRGQAVQVSIKHRVSRITMSHTLTTDEEGSIHLGPLGGVEQVIATLSGGAGYGLYDGQHSRAWYLSPHAGMYAGEAPPGTELAPLPGTLHGTDAHGATLSLPYVLPYTTEGDDVSDKDGITLFKMSGAAVVEDCSAHVTLDGRAGYVTLQGLARGDYALHIPRKKTTIKVLIAGTATAPTATSAPPKKIALSEPDLAPASSSSAGGPSSTSASSATALLASQLYILGDHRLLERSLRSPLTIAKVAAPGDQGGGGGALRVHLGGTHARAARVHVVLRHLLPSCGNAAAMNVAAGLSLGPPRDPCMIAVSKPATHFLEKRQLGDEHRYILERQHAPKHVGIMLDRPRLLLNWWSTKDTSSEEQKVQGGGAYAKKKMAVGQQRGGGGQREQLLETSEELASVNFSTPCLSLANLTPDAQGVVHVPGELLAARSPGQTLLQVLAIDPLGHTAYVERPVADVARVKASSGALIPYRTMSLPKELALDPLRHFLERRAISLLWPAASGGVTAGIRNTCVIADTTTSTVKVYSTLDEVHCLFSTLGVPATETSQQRGAWDAFGRALLFWPTLATSQKMELLSLHASHELHLFLYFKDPVFFDQVVAPFLRHKMHRTFLDRYLLGEPLGRYYTLAEYGRLNALERCLLAERLGGASGRAIWREMKDQLDAAKHSLSPEAGIAAFNAAVKGGALNAPQGGDTGGADGADLFAQAFGGLPPQQPQQYHFQPQQQVQLQQQSARMAAPSRRMAPVPQMAFAACGSGPAPKMMMAMAMAPPPPPCPAPGGAPGRMLLESSCNDAMLSEFDEVTMNVGRMSRMDVREEESQEYNLNNVDDEMDDYEGNKLDVDSQELFGRSKADLSKRKAVAKLYQPLEKTREYAESNYYRRLPSCSDDNSDVVPLSSFWLDFCAHLVGADPDASAPDDVMMLEGGARVSAAVEASLAAPLTSSPTLTSSSSSAAAAPAPAAESEQGQAERAVCARRPFISEHVTDAGRNWTSAVMALAVLCLPLARRAAAAGPPRGAQGHMGTTGTGTDHPQGDAAPSVVTSAGAAESSLVGMHYEGPRLTITPGGATPVIVFHKEICEADLGGADGQGAGTDGAPGTPGGAQIKILAGQTLFDPADRYTYSENGAMMQRTVKGPLQVGRCYGYEVVITNVTSNRQSLTALLQIPEGAVPLAASFYTKQLHIDLDPFSTDKREFFFYFPSPGTFSQFAAHVSHKDQLLACATLPLSLEVTNTVVVPARREEWTWSEVAANGTNAEVLAFLEKSNLALLDLNQVCWRCKERAFHASLLDALRSRLAFRWDIWRYAVLHGDLGGIREFLPMCRPWFTQHLLPAPAVTDHRLDVSEDGGRGSGGWSMASQQLQQQKQQKQQAICQPSLAMDAVELALFRHLEYYPLVNPRVNPFGSAQHRAKILNDALRRQYRAFLHYASRQPELSPVTALAGAYYLLLQDRVDDARMAFASAGAIGEEEGDGPLRMQYDYMLAYLDMLSDDPVPSVALALAAKYLGRKPTSRGGGDGDHRPDEAGASDTPRARLEDASASGGGSSAAAARDGDAGGGGSAGGSSTNRVLPPHWQRMWQELAQHLDEALAVEHVAHAAAAVGREGGEGAAAPRGLSLQGTVLEASLTDGGAIHIEHTGVERVQIKYYLMDIELLFSSNPFVSQGELGQFSFITPNHTQTVDVTAPSPDGGALMSAAAAATGADAGGSKTARQRTLVAALALASLDVPLPPQMATSNVLIEVSAAGIRRTLVKYSNQMTVHVAEAQGQLKVTATSSKASIADSNAHTPAAEVAGPGEVAVLPVVGAYLKVYCRESSGKVQFCKDGYTDRRGRFDYASVSTIQLERVQRFSILIMSEEHGAIIREVNPPGRTGATRVV